MNTPISISSGSQPPLPFPGLYNYYLLLPSSPTVTSTQPSSPLVILSEDGGYWYVPQTSNHLPLQTYTQPHLQVVCSNPCPPAPSHHAKLGSMTTPFKPFRPWECEPRKDTSARSSLAYSSIPYYPGVEEVVEKKRREILLDMTEEVEDSIGGGGENERREDTSNPKVQVVPVEIIQEKEKEANIEGKLNEKVTSVVCDNEKVLNLVNVEENSIESSQKVSEKAKKLEVQGGKKNIVGHKVDALTKKKNVAAPEKPEEVTATGGRSVWSRLGAGRRAQGQQMAMEKVPFNEADFPALMSKMKIKK